MDAKKLTLALAVATGLAFGVAPALAQDTAKNQPSQEAAQIVDATNPEMLVTIFQDLGYRARLTTDSQDDPLIEVKVSGVDTSVFFYGCTENKDCGQIQFRAAFNMNGKGSPAEMQAWNKDRLFGVAFLDSEFDPVIELAVNLRGGVSRDNLADTVDWWDVVLSQFKEHIGF
ncbi:MAG: YbjN domain-containing protein [Rhodobiaceae bacterium]|nr:YbjN domain-containing protein [Rhodobiaceae bacterium]MCC0053284.1 YbjN domain-containing protein [Rhodobiaceae bacterium]